MSHRFKLVILLSFVISASHAQQVNPLTPDGFTLLAGNEREGKVYFLVHHEAEDKSYRPKEKWCVNDSTFNIRSFFRQQRRTWVGLNWTWVEYLNSYRTRGGGRVFIPISYSMFGKKYDWMISNKGIP